MIPKRLFSLEECKHIIDFAENEINNEWDHQLELDADGNVFCQYYVKSLNNHTIARERFKSFINNEFSFSVSHANMYILKYLPGFKFGRHFDRNLSKELNKDFIYNVNVILNDAAKIRFFSLISKCLSEKYLI